MALVGPSAGHTRCGGAEHDARVDSGEKSSLADENKKKRLCPYLPLIIGAESAATEAEPRLAR